MTPEERQDMVRGMVAQLSERLATQGGSAGEWARLIAAYGVLGETDRAQAIWAEAQQRFAGRAADLEVVRAAAAQAGVAE
jgi:cytochrome c-type biogenesis protein CcmH